MTRMEGAVVAFGPDPGHPPTGTDHDRLAEMLGGSTVPAAPFARPGARGALAAIAEGAEPEHARAAIAVLKLDLPAGAQGPSS